MPKKSKKHTLNPYGRATPASSNRNKTLRIVSIWIILSLILSFLFGALAFTPSTAAALEIVQLGNQSPSTQLVDTDGDGIENNLDPDVDGDGLVNAEDKDIDGDGIENFDDADPIDTTDIDSTAPEKPQRPQVETAGLFQTSAWAWISAAMVLASILAAIITVKRRQK